MASLLHSIGRWCAHHAWRVVAGWVALLVALGALAGAFSQPLSNEISIPGSDFERVLDDLQTEVPEASGGFGTVVLKSDSDEFTAEQRDAIRDVFGEWEELSEVRAVQDPFTNQQQLDDTTTQVSEGGEQIDDAQTQLDDGWSQLSEGQGQLAQGEEWLRRLADTPDSDPTKADIIRQVEQGRLQVAIGYGQWATSDRALASAEDDYQDGLTAQQMLGDTRFVTDDGYALAQVQFTTDAQSVDPEVKEAIPEIGEQLEDAGVTAEYSVDITQENSLLGPGEAVGVMIAALVLLIALGSIVAAGLPLAGALVGVGTGLLAALAATQFFDMHSLTPSLALMLGLAVGIDYALFIVNRHRTQLLAGRPMQESIAHAVGTSGSAVTIAGTTVVIALVALLVTGIPLLGQMGLVAAVTVAVAVVVALTLTPALLHLVGTRVLSRRAWRRAGFSTPGVPDPGAELDEDGEEHGTGYVAAVTRRPALVAVGVVLLCGVLAVPALSIRLGLPDGGSEPVDSTAHAAYVEAGEKFGAGTNGPVIAVASFADPVAEDEVTHEQALVGNEMSYVDGVASVVPFGVSEDRRTLAFQVIPETGPAEEDTVTTVRELQATGPAIERATGAEMGFTGQTVANIEISQQLSDALPPYLGIVVGLSLLLLTIVFRSILVPLTATLGFLLSVAVSFGATVAVYQWGWLGGIFAVDTPGPVLSFMPIMLIGVLFGLAMDYQMFLVSGMKEAHTHGESARSAVRTGFGHGANVVAAAAIIMTSVFAGFIFAHLTMIRPIGFGLAVGVLVDAFLVRMTLIPALMHLMGEWAWAFPKWLSWVPKVDAEGASLAWPDEDRATAEEADDVDEDETATDGASTDEVPAAARS
ncbi:MMPL family transporter [Janibacter alkaliphilus]|uniref:RND superfamily putative drug exporter n=1 Tax=Janibacter alkaliphilus TaxID=1069963 RepID=A0A852XCX0_9MICO|nr:MMPL family transporter [Janibacter alkaliphilus]NYG36311.1 RND superfamily putative drug exporter [Janibacter alkaliphilus]